MLYVSSLAPSCILFSRPFGLEKKKNKEKEKCLSTILWVSELAYKATILLLLFLIQAKEWKPPIIIFCLDKFSLRCCAFRHNLLGDIYPVSKEKVKGKHLNPGNICKQNHKSKCFLLVPLCIFKHFQSSSDRVPPTHTHTWSVCGTEPGRINLGPLLI